MDKQLTGDVLVIGSGIAGLSVAIKTAQRFPERKVIVASKAKLKLANTALAQGGIAVVWDREKDSFHQHIEDTLIAGDGLCDREIVELVIEEGPQRLQELIEWGTKFDRSCTGGFHLGREGGHSAHRILHAKDQTGVAVLNTLITQAKKLKNIRILEQHVAVRLLTRQVVDANQGLKNSCCGAILAGLEKKENLKVHAAFTILATGGAGQVFETTTNPDIATGDGLALAHRAGAETDRMEFIQFHPTAFFNPKESPSFLISEAVRGAGAVLRNRQGEAFMERYDKRGSLAPRDIVARSIQKECRKEKEEHVYLDATKIPARQLLTHFPNIYQKCLQHGIDMSREWIPVAPAAHYFCGGIKTDAHGRTSLPQLYAIGECASTGLHGANRLASNSLLEALVFAERSFRHLSLQLEHVSLPAIAIESEGGISCFEGRYPWADAYRSSLQQLAAKYLGIERKTTELLYLQKELQKMQRRIHALKKSHAYSPQVFELESLLTTACLITESALNRKENCGLHFLAEN